jgi:uncharacterized lipoprotein YddW (UPF0748 family)
MTGMGSSHFGPRRLPFALFAVVLLALVEPGCLSLNGAPSQIARDTPPPAVRDTPPPAVRAIWVQAEAADTPQDADRMISHVKRGGLNTILYEIGAGDVNYRSKLLPQSRYVTSQYDPLAYVVKQAHANGLKVQAWWSCGPAPDSEAFRARYPTFDVALMAAIPHGAHWLNFSLPEVKQFVGDVVLEIAQNYDVDGIHLDYIRYPDDLDPNGGTFSAGDVSGTVQSVYQRLKAVKPGTELTAAVASDQSDAHDRRQNWADWLAGGYIDRVFPMAYFDPGRTYLSGGRWTLEIDAGQWQGLTHPERIAPGLRALYNDGSTPKTPEQFMAQVELCKKYGFGDMSLFDERTVTDEILDALATKSK